MNCRLSGTLMLLVTLASVSTVSAENPVTPAIPIGSANVDDLLNNYESVVVSPMMKPQATQKNPADKTRKPRKPSVSSLPSIGYVPEDRKPAIPKNKQLSRAERLFKQSLNLRASSPAEAQQLLEQVLAINPAHRSARLALGSHLVKSSQTEKAARILQPLLYNSNPDWQPWFWYGTALLQLGDFNQAGQVLDLALIRERQEPAIWVQRAIVEQERGSAENALKLLNAAARLSTGQPTVMLNIAVAANSMDGLDHKTKAYYNKYQALKHRVSDESSD